jgi:hypothetical protein
MSSMVGTIGIGNPAPVTKKAFVEDIALSTGATRSSVLLGKSRRECWIDTIYVKT